MLHEVVNALFFTYVATEYLIAAEDAHVDGRGRGPWAILSASKSLRVVTAAVAAANVLSRLHLHLSDASAAGRTVADAVGHVPGVVLAAAAYVLALFYDCRRSQPSLTVLSLLKRVGAAFCRVAPIYPFLAILISFVFLFVISAFEYLRLPLEWLNMPIYYGTLYGPFSWMYWIVKRRVVEDCEFLPTTTARAMASSATMRAAATEAHRSGERDKRDVCLDAALRRNA